jgi:hypothetical protein
VIANRNTYSIAINASKTIRVVAIPAAPAHLWPRERFIAEAVRRAEAAGLYPAELQRAVDWDAVIEWAERVRRPGFAWRRSDPWTADAIVVGPRKGGVGRVVHSGQHRILGGLMGGNPVPDTHVSRIGIEDAGRGWLDPVRTPDLLTLLGL